MKRGRTSHGWATFPNRWSAAAEVGGALLGEGPRSLFGVLGVEHGLAVVALVGERLVLGHAVRLVQRLEDGLHGQRSVGGDDPGDLAGPAQRFAGGDDVPDEPELL